MLKRTKEGIINSLKTDLNKLHIDYLSGVHAPVVDAFNAAVDKRYQSYEQQAKFNQIPKDIAWICLISALTTILPVTAVGARAGNWVAQSFLVRLMGKSVFNRGIGRALVRTKAKASMRKLGFQGFSSDPSTPVGHFTYVGSRLANDMVGYTGFYLRVKVFAEKTSPMETIKEGTSRVDLDPKYFSSKFALHIKDHFNKWYDFCEAAGKTLGLNDETAVTFDRMVRKAHVFSEIKAIKNEVVEEIEATPLAGKFELIFYLHDILNGDVLVESDEIVGSGGRGEASGFTQTPIDTLPSSPNYPKASTEIMGARVYRKSIKTFDPGTKVGARINTLYRYFINKNEDFFDNWYVFNDVDHEVMLRAEEALITLIGDVNSVFDFK